MSGRRLPRHLEGRVLEILEGVTDDREGLLAELYREHPEHEAAIRARLASTAAIWQRLDRALAPELAHPAQIGPYYRESLATFERLRAEIRACDDRLSQ